jgi:hypothetical protein
MFRTKPGEERALIKDWINRPALRKLVEAFGGTWPTGDLETIVAQLVDFSEIWDYRAGKHDRHVFHDDQDEPDPHTELTYWAAEELGMINPPPPSQPSYDYLLILGGLATGVEPRVKYAAHLVAKGLVVKQQIAALGSFRILRPQELPISTRYAPAGKFEIDHLSAMMSEILGSGGSWTESGGGDPNQNPALASRIQVSSIPGLELATYAAPSSDPSCRPANTADTYEFVAEAAEFEPGDRLLIVTSAIYLPYQHFDAVRTLSTYSLDLETVGARRSSRGRSHPAAAFRQEVRSGIISSQRLLQAIEAPGLGRTADIP